MRSNKGEVKNALGLSTLIGGENHNIPTVHIYILYIPTVYILKLWFILSGAHQARRQGGCRGVQGGAHGLNGV